MEYRVINDKMSRDEIVDVFRHDHDAQFRYVLNWKIEKAINKYKKKRLNDKIIGKFSVRGKSGQDYQYVVYKFNVSKNSSSCAIIQYVKLFTKYGTVYYTVSSDSMKEIYGIDYDYCDDTLTVNRFTSHVINRYVERSGGKNYGEAGFIDFCLDNLCFDAKDVGDGTVLGHTKYGALVGHEKNGKTCFNTYYNNSMLASSSKYRKSYNYTNIEGDIEMLKSKMLIDSTRHHIEQGTISTQEIVGMINEIHSTMQNVRNNNSNGNEKISIHLIGADWGALFPERKSKLCVPSCIQG